MEKTDRKSAFSVDVELEGRAAKSAVEQWRERAETQAAANKAFCQSMREALQAREDREEIKRLELLATPMLRKLEELKGALSVWRRANPGLWDLERLHGVLVGWDFSTDDRGWVRFGIRDWESKLTCQLGEEIRIAVMDVFRGGLSRKQIDIYAEMIVTEVDTLGLPEEKPVLLTVDGKSRSEKTVPMMGLQTVDGGKV